MLELIIFCAVIALLELDTTYFGQVLVSRPVVVGSLLGFISGNFFLGLQIGRARLRIGKELPVQCR